MAIFGSNNNTESKPAKAPVTNTSTTIITAGALLKGEITLECDVFFDGRVEGTMHSKGVITVGQNGVIVGEVKAPHLIVRGRIEGTVDVDRVEIKENGYVGGIISSKEMVIESKGIFEGESHRKTTQTAAKPVQEAAAEKPAEKKS
uniref:bactofilin family protein n=1 Tax=Thiomicrolovo subterrani TaxID=3131934 RepID=UPI003F63A8CB